MSNVDKDSDMLMEFLRNMVLFGSRLENIDIWGEWSKLSNQFLMRRETMHGLNEVCEKGYTACSFSHSSGPRMGIGTSAPLGSFPILAIPE